MHLPDPATLAAYSLACLVLYITPGPDMSLILARTLSGGRRAGIVAGLGVCLGLLAHTALAAVGLSALLAASATAFATLKVAGALYLGWLAVQAVRRGSGLGALPAGGPVSARRAFLAGLAVNLLNPKIALFFLTFLPQFVDAGDPAAGAKLAFLGAWFVVLFCLPLNVVLVLGAERAVDALRASPRVLRAVDYVFAGVFGAFALKLLATPGR